MASYKAMDGSGYTAQGWKKTKGPALTKVRSFLFVNTLTDPFESVAGLRVRSFIQADRRKECPSGDKSPPSFFSSEMNLRARMGISFLVRFLLSSNLCIALFNVRFRHAAPSVH
jgi:hypothetical protein